MNPEKLQAWRFHRQGLDGSLAGRSASDILHSTGWTRSVGSANPYLALFARGSLGRQATDEAAGRVEIQELPAARGCTYIVPAPDYALALKVGAPFASEIKTARRLGVKDAEIDRLCGAVAAALARGPLEPDELRQAAGRAARNLGEEGKKRGLANTLPVALERMQSEGEIRRIPAGRRLNQQRYRYALWRPNPLSRCRLSEAEAFTELARRFFSWIGPARLEEFQWFSGLGAKAARVAASLLNLKPAATGSDLLMLPEDLAEFRAFKPPRKAQPVLVCSLDGISHLRRDIEGLLATEDLKRTFFFGRGLTDLSSHAILSGGRLIGLWEYDVAAESIVWASFVPVTRRIEEAVARTARFVREELGDARAFSLDSPKSRAPRIEALRKLTARSVSYKR